MRRTVDTYLSLPRRRYFSAIELHAVAIGSIAAAVLIIGYGFNFPPLQTLLPGFPAMRPVTAALLMILSICCLLSLRGNRRLELLSAAIAGAVIVYLVFEDATHFNTPDFPLAQFQSILGTTLSVLFAAAAMVVINLRPRWSLLVGAIALAAAVPALYRIFGLLLFWGAPRDLSSPFSSMGLHTAILIVWYMLVCVLMHPRLPFAAAVLQASLRGRVLRAGLPVIVFVPVIASVASLVLSVSMGWPVEALFALNAALSVTLAGLLIWWLSRLAADWQKQANEQASRLSRANEALEQYASSAAHDLKAPARHVLLYGELLDEALARGDLTSARKHSRAIRDSASDMPRMIEGLLDYSRSAFTRIQPTEQQLSELVQAASAQNAKELEAAQAQVALLHDMQVRCDSTLITTVFQNLIANSIKNRRKDKPLEIRIDAMKEPDGWRLSVEDNGVGFDPDFASVAFNPLARGIHTAGDGAGIGLSTCRNIVQSHGGEIRVDPNYRTGARIEFTLPTNPVAQQHG